MKADTAQCEIDRKMRQHALRTIAEADLVVMAKSVVDRSPPLKLPRDPDLLVNTKIDLTPMNTGQFPPLKCITSAQSMEWDGRTAQLSTFYASAKRRSQRPWHLMHDIPGRFPMAERRSDAWQVNPSGPEFIALGMREVLDALSSVTGRISADDLLGRIFAAFCIGK